MKRLLLVLTLVLTMFLAVGCDTECGEGECRYWPTQNDELDFLDDCDYYLLTVVDRRDSGDGYEYIFQENGQETTEDWFYSEKLFSIGEYVLGIEYGTPEELALYDLS